MFHPTDPVSKELRQIETYVDNYYKTNYLVNLPFAISAWHFMSFCEDVSFKNIQNENVQTIHDIAASVDNFVVQLNYPILWLYNSCALSGLIPYKYDDHCYKAAWEISKLGNEYIAFESAFVCASRYIIELRIDNNTIKASPFFQNNAQYEAYDRMIGRGNSPIDYDIDKFNEFIELIVNSLRIKGGRFNYNLNPRIVKLAIEILLPAMERKFILPNQWQFSHYSIDEFRKFAISLAAICFIHFNARLHAAMHGCANLGYSDSVFIASQFELLRRLVRYSSVSESALGYLIEDMTYGNRNISKPDPAIQPIIKMNENNLAIIPSLVISCNMERNFTILLNKIPSEKYIYSQLVSEKEKLMRQRIIDNISISDLRYIYGNIFEDKSIPDIDLLIISDTEKICLFLELKWFIGPAEVREVIEKSEEIDKGIKQLIIISNVISKDIDFIINKIKIDSSYELFYSVISDNSIGMHHIQNPNVPVIQESHFVNKLNKTMSLTQTSKWLIKKE